MKIVMTNTADHTRKVVKFGELIKCLQDKNFNVINRRWINTKLLNNETISVDGYEFKKGIS